MPLYVYRCERGHVFEVVHRMDGSDAPHACPNYILLDNGGDPPDQEPCDAPIVKQLSAPAGSFPGADSWRR